MTDDVLRDHHGVVDDEADGDRHRTEGHQVERLPEQPHHEDRDDERERDRRRAHRRDPAVTQEEEEDDDGERGADQHGVAHRLDGVAHEGRLVVHGLEPDPGGERACQTAHHAGDAVGDRECVAAHLAGDVDLRHGLPVTRDDADAVLGAWRHGREIPHA